MGWRVLGLERKLAAVDVLEHADEVLQRLRSADEERELERREHVQLGGEDLLGGHAEALLELLHQPHRGREFEAAMLVELAGQQQVCSSMLAACTWTRLTP